jgi:hypothetical protein
MKALYYTMAADGSQAGPFSHEQMVLALQQGKIRRESLVRRADLAEFFAMESYPEFTQAVPVRAVPRVAAAGVRPKSVENREAVSPVKQAEAAAVVVWGL